MPRKATKNLVMSEKPARFSRYLQTLPLNVYVRALVIALFVLAALPLTPLRAQTNPTTPANLPEALAGQDYSFTFNPSGGTPPLTWRIVSGSLPEGISLESTSGRLHGTTTAAKAEPYIFTVEVTDSATPNRQKFLKQFALFVRQSSQNPLSIADPSAGANPDNAVEDEQISCNGINDIMEVESNSDTISIAVRNTYTYKKENEVFNLNDKKEPIPKVNELIAETIGQCYLASKQTKNQAKSNDDPPKYKWEHDDYIVIHVIKWPEMDPSARPGNPAKYEAEKEKWFLYRNLDKTGDKPNFVLQEGTRIYGHERVAVLVVHLTARDGWDIKYTVDVKTKTPAPVQNALTLASIILGGDNKASGLNRTDRPSYWGGKLLLIKDLPADIAVASNIIFLPPANIQAGMAAQGEEVQQTQQPKQYSKTFDNEGRYHWDVSVGLPVKGFKEVKYDAENGQVTAREVNRQNAYGFLNIFLNPNGVDTKGYEHSYKEFYKTTHLVVGVPISGKPLDRPMVGLGFGFYKPSFKFNLFGGAVFNRVREPRTLATGEAATPADLEGDLVTRRVTKFIFGFNIPVKQFADALKPKK